MPAERFYKDIDLHGLISIEGAEHHHLAHVMRVRIGDEIEVVNGRGGLARAKVIAISRHDASLEILTASQTSTLASKLSLAVPLMRPSKLELVIEKCTELGADAFYLYPAQYSEKDDLSQHQVDRLHLIAISAMKQCGRLDLPPLKLVDSLNDLLIMPAIFLFGDTRPNTEFHREKENVVFITGPEKGFSTKELELLDKKAKGVRLHRNILRAETAPIVASVLYQTK
jgi:16S rRNA (uracil1498-N3)-methyltransferase